MATIMYNGVSNFAIKFKGGLVSESVSYCLVELMKNERNRH